MNFCVDDLFIFIEVHKHISLNISCQQWLLPWGHSFSLQCSVSFHFEPNLCKLVPVSIYNIKIPLQRSRIPFSNLWWQPVGCMSPICMSAYWILIYYKMLTGTKPFLWQVWPLMPEKAWQAALGKAHWMCCSQSLGAVWTCSPILSAQNSTTRMIVTWPVSWV